MARGNPRGTLPLSFMIPKVDYVPPKVHELPSWAGAKRICIDVETKDPDLNDLGPGDFRPGNHIVGYGVAIDDGPAFYLPIRHEGGDNLDPDHVVAYMQNQAQWYDGEVVGANLLYDLGFCRKDGVHFPNVKKFKDVLNCAVLEYELHFKYSLDAVCERAGIPGKDKTRFLEFAKAYGVDPKTELYKLPGRACEEYVLRDLRAPLELHKIQEKSIETLGIGQIWNTETDFLPVLHDMRGRGLRVNIDKVHKIRTWATAQGTQHLHHLKQLTGAELGFHEVWNAQAIAKILSRAGVKVGMTAKGKPSIKKSVLKGLGEIGNAIKRARDFSKVCQFADRTLRYQIKGRVHCVINQLKNTKEDPTADVDDESEQSKGARYGRCAAEHYNIQQEFGRDDEFAALWREIYEAEEGELFVSADWSQQEPRIAVHYAEILGLTGAKEFADRYRSDPTTDCHQLLADLTGIIRKIVKNYFNGSIYGMGDAKLCIAIEQPTVLVNRHGKVQEVPGPEGARIIKKFRDAVPWVFELTKAFADVAARRGHVWTIGKRRCNFPRSLDGKRYDWTHKAGSRIGQGGAADQMKETSIACRKAGIPLRGTVHDELLFSTRDKKQAFLCKELMETTRRFNVPMLVDLEVGNNWGNGKKISKAGEAYFDEMLASLN